MRPLTYIAPLSLLTAVVPAQGNLTCDHDVPCDHCTSAPTCTQPAFAPLPSQSTLAPQWESLDLPDSDPALGPQAPDAQADPSPAISLFPDDPLLRPQPVIDPFATMQQQMRQMEAMQREMQERINRQLKPLAQQGVQMHGFSSQGSGLEDRGDHYAIEMEIQGLNCATPQLSLRGDMLTFQCRQTQEVTETTPNGDVQCRGRFTNNIMQSWSLPSDADRQSIDATVDGSHVSITIAKQETDEGRDPSGPRAPLNALRD